MRLIETEKDLSPGFGVTYLGIRCHDNAVFDVSWSPDDHQLVRHNESRDWVDLLVLLTKTL